MIREGSPVVIGQTVSVVGHRGDDYPIDLRVQSSNGWNSKREHKQREARTASTSGSTLSKTTECGTDRRRTRSQVFDEPFSRFREPTPTESKPATQCNNRSLVYVAS